MSTLDEYLNALAISYARFSDPKQEDGDSEDRQLQMFLRFCEIHKLTPAAQNFMDRGRSGYHGKHRTKGQFKLLEEMAKRKEFPKGTVIVIEAWDRLGRMVPDKQTELVVGLLKAG